MHFRVIILIFAITTSCFEAKNYILKLNDENYLKKALESKLLLTLFYVPWTAKLNNEMLLTLKVVSKAMSTNNTNILVGKMDCSKDGVATCDIVNVGKYPELQIIRNNSAPYKYNGPFDSSGMSMSLRIFAKDPGSFELKSNTDLDTFMSVDKVVTIICFIREENELKEMFLKAAIELEYICRFAHISFEDDDFKQDGLEGNIIMYHPEYLHNKFEEKSYMFQGETIDDFKTFISLHYHGLVGVKTSENSNDFKKPLAVAYYHVDFTWHEEKTKKWRNLMLPVANKFRNRFHFAISAKDESHEIAHEYGIKFEDRDEPYVLARDSKNRKFILNETLTESSLRKFVNKILSKKIQNFILSQPIPDWNNGYVKVAVHNNFKEMVTTNPKDVFILFYAPWCKHCTELQPIFEDLGKALIYEDVDIVHMDATNNDVPTNFNLTRFPDIFWYPKIKAKPISYEAERGLQDFIRYISKHATTELKSYDRKGKLKKPKTKEDIAKDEL